MTAYLRKMGIDLSNAAGSGTSGGFINDIGDGGTGVETGLRVDTTIESDSNNLGPGFDGLELVSGTGPESPVTTTVTPLTDEEFLMVKNA